MTHDARTDSQWRGALQLLVLQPTPFCNLDCTYCYLPNRNDKSRMEMGTLARVLDAVVHEGWVGPQLSVVWHAGEPLVLGTDWYEEAFAIVEARLPPGTTVRHNFQTNAVLIDDAWCAFFGRDDVRVGVSVDGPAFLHDARRKTRDGRGTHSKVMRGIDRLRARGIPFHAICVLTREALRYPDEIFDFFEHLGAIEVGFNVEEVEAANARSSLLDEDVGADFVTFFRRILERRRTASKLVRVREIENVLAAIQSPYLGMFEGNSQNMFGRILSVGWDGAFTSWSPELLGASHPRHGSMALGTSLEGGLSPASRARLELFQEEIDAGVRACRDTCKHFDICLGGAPSNKLGEHGRFDVTETMFCRLTVKAVNNVVLEALDSLLPAEPSR